MTTYIIEIIGIVAGLFFCIMGVAKYGLWEEITILGGFLPAVCGAATALLSALMIRAKIKRGDKAESFDIKSLIPVGAMILILLCNYLVGLMGACLVISLLWLRFVEKISRIKSILICAVFFAFMYAIFRVWLRVPLPTGLLGQLL